MAWFRRVFRRGAAEARDADEAFRQALLAVLDRDWDRAERALARAAKLDPGAVMPYLAIGRLFRSRGEIGRAIQTHHNLLVRQDLRPDERVSALAELAADFQHGGFLKRAVAAYEEVLSHDPSHEPALVALTRLYADLRSFPQALEAARNLRRITGHKGREDEVHLLVEMAEAARSEGREGDARKSVKKALRLDPSCARGWLVLGSIEADRGRNKPALAAWRRVPGCDPRSGPLVYPQLEAAFASLGQSRDFETFLRAHLEEQPDDAAARLALARTLAARGDTEASRTEARQVLDRVPDSLEAHTVLGRVLLDEQREAEIAKGYDELLSLLERQNDLRLRESSE